MRTKSIEEARKVFTPKYNNLKQKVTKTQWWLSPTPPHTVSLSMSACVKIAADTQWIMYGVKEPHARQRFLDAFGCTKFVGRPAFGGCCLSPQGQRLPAGGRTRRWP